MKISRAVLAFCFCLSSELAFAQTVAFESCQREKDTEQSYICRPTRLSTKDTAFVFVDFWEDPANPKQEKKFYREASQLLEQLRKNDFFVIHGAGNSVFEFPKYQNFRTEVEEFLGPDFCLKKTEYGGERRKLIFGFQKRTNACPREGPDEMGRISPLIYPDTKRQREYLVRWEDEIRYVLWKNKIKNLVYLGSNIERCVLHRPYGIFTLLGHDTDRSDFNIYILQGLIKGALNSVKGVSQDQKNEVFLRSIGFNLVRVVPPQDIEFMSFLPPLTAKK